MPKPLMFTVGLIDQITKPIAKISSRLNGLSANYQAGTMQMASGIGGVAASGYALQKALQPALDIQRALGEVKSLGVADSGLKMLTENAYSYALKYGESATDFIRSSYDIQSAIEGLNDADLSRFTMASNVLAKATKADAATITNYMGTMYGIFKNDAKNMGEGAWIERVTGMTATAVKAFKTDGKKMSDAFGALGASAGLAPLEEQMAIMGKLQATMQGSDSATKYKAFLAGVGKAQKALNLQFTDAQGNMLPMVDILNKIKGKYGDVINVAEGQALTTAFGSDQATQLIGLLINDVNGLAGSIDQLGKVNGMQQAEKMAAAMVDQSNRLAQSWFVIRAAFGSAILPAFNSFVSKLADMGTSVMWFTEMFPNITRWLGYLGVGLLLAVAAGGLFNIVMGASKMAMVAWGVAVLAMKGVISILSAGMLVFKGVMWAVNAVMYANPILLIVAGIVAAIAAVAALVYYWDDLVAAVSNWGWIKAIGEMFSNLWAGIKDGLKSIGAWFSDATSAVSNTLKTLGSFIINVLSVPFKIVTAVSEMMFSSIQYGIDGLVMSVKWLADVIHNGFSIAFDLVSVGWQALTDTFSNFEWFKKLTGAASSIGKFMSELWAGIKTTFAKTFGWIAEKLNKLPGINIAIDPVVEQLDTTQLKNLGNVSGVMPNRAANDTVSYVYAKPVAANDAVFSLAAKAPYMPESITQPGIAPVVNESLSNAISPKVNQQMAASAQANRTASQKVNGGKTISFGDVIVQNPPKNFSLSELADQQELLTA